ncbi:hypothetical protein ACFSSA_13945 [Luteolibacter algae]|uniref:Uncharacterized protein n=1 Tax=Luteolibacter algae TaxID=454151 RepID=A0ABW5DAG0_9BACT
MKSISNIISIALIGCGAAGFVFASGPLLKNRDIDVPLNVLGINHSPYGEVFAMAMQGPIDNYWHATADVGHVCEDPEHCEHHPVKDTKSKASNESLALDDKLRNFIEGLAQGLEERTNPKSASSAHKFFIRRGIEDKLRFAYNLDPGHYGNYNAYHFFLTEPQLGTRPELTAGAAKLANHTITYCLNQRNDPRQALTAAAAAGNVVELMLNDRLIHDQNPRYTTAQMRNVLKVMDQSLALYAELSEDWSVNHKWENLSEMRVTEALERFNFVLKIRKAHEASISRLEGLPLDRNFSLGTSIVTDSTAN